MNFNILHLNMLLYSMVCTLYSIWCLTFHETNCIKLIEVDQKQSEVIKSNQT